MPKLTAEQKKMYMAMGLSGETVRRVGGDIAVSTAMHSAAQHSPC